MNIFSFRKKIVILAIFFVSFLTIILVLILIFFPFKSSTEKISKDINEEILLYKDYIPIDQIRKDLALLNNASASEDERYDALLDIFFYLDNAYFNSGAPRIREFTSTLDKYAQDNFKNKYKKEDFYIACADYICGEKTPPEIEKLLEEIKKLPIDEVWINSITLNIKTASHIPYDNDFNKMDKLHSYSLAMGMLITNGNEEASKSAEKLKKFVKNKYNKNL